MILALFLPTRLSLTHLTPPTPQIHSPSSSQDIEAFYSFSTCFKSLDELFPPSTSVFMVGNPYYGAMGEVCDQFSALSESESV